MSSDVVLVLVDAAVLLEYLLIPKLPQLIVRRFVKFFLFLVKVSIFSSDSVHQSGIF